MKKISLKNYIILLLIIVFSIFLTLYVLNIYKQYKNNNNSNEINTVLNEIKYNDLDTILQERDFLVVYTCSNNNKCKVFDNYFNDYIIDNNLDEEIIYLDLNNNRNILTNIYNKYKHPDLMKRIYNYPAILIFSNGKIIDLISTNNDNLSIDIVEHFLKGYFI